VSECSWATVAADFDEVGDRVARRRWQGFASAVPTPNFEFLTSASAGGNGQGREVGAGLSFRSSTSIANFWVHPFEAGIRSIRRRRLAFFEVE
jgi:hypothetical protein